MKYEWCDWKALSAFAHFMFTLEFKEMVEVSTPKGDGLIWYMMDYGPQSDTIYTIIIKETGECWQMCHKDFRVKMNATMGIIKGYGKIGEKPAAMNGKNAGMQLNGSENNS